METEGIGELSNFIICCILLLTSITSFVSAWISDKRSFKIRRIILGTILVTFFVILLLTSKEIN
jgi:riboflavin transporter FmnP